MAAREYGAIGLLLASACAMGDRALAGASPSPPSGAAILVELFSSEGCSSCPPAEAFLRDVDSGRVLDGVRVVGDWVAVHVDRTDLRSAERKDVYLAVAEGGLRSEVTAGENRGQILSHAPVVRRLTELGPVDGAVF